MHLLIPFNLVALHITSKEKCGNPGEVGMTPLIRFAIKPNTFSSLISHLGCIYNMLRSLHSLNAGVHDTRNLPGNTSNEQFWIPCVAEYFDVYPNIQIDFLTYCSSMVSLYQCNLCVMRTIVLFISRLIPSILLSICCVVSQDVYFDMRNIAIIVKLVPI